MDLRIPLEVGSDSPAIMSSRPRLSRRLFRAARRVLIPTTTAVATVAGARYAAREYLRRSYDHDAQDDHFLPADHRPITDPAELEELYWIAKRCSLLARDMDYRYINRWHHANDYWGGITFRQFDEESKVYANGYLDKLTNESEKMRRLCYYLYYELDGKTGARKYEVFIRGTISWADIFYDLSFRKVFDKEVGKFCHSGFLAKSELLLQDLGLLLSDEKGEIAVHGHSLGGSMAAIIGEKLARRGFVVTRVTSFGGPKFWTNWGGGNAGGDLVCTAGEKPLRERAWEGVVGGISGGWEWVRGVVSGVAGGGGWVGADGPSRTVVARELHPPQARVVVSAENAERTRGSASTTDEDLTEAGRTRGEWPAPAPMKSSENNKSVRKLVSIAHEQDFIPCFPVDGPVGYAFKGGYERPQIGTYVLSNRRCSPDPSAHPRRILRADDPACSQEAKISAVARRESDEELGGSFSTFFTAYVEPLMKSPDLPVREETVASCLYYVEPPNKAPDALSPASDAPFRWWLRFSFLLSPFSSLEYHRMGNYARSLELTLERARVARAGDEDNGGRSDDGGRSEEEIPGQQDHFAKEESWSDAAQQALERARVVVAPGGRRRRPDQEEVDAGSGGVDQASGCVESDRMESDSRLLRALPAEEEEEEQRSSSSGRTTRRGEMRGASPVGAVESVLAIAT